MHTAVLTAEHEVFTWGVNDEGALGRETGGWGMGMRAAGGWLWSHLKAALLQSTQCNPSCCACPAPLVPTCAPCQLVSAVSRQHALSTTCPPTNQINQPPPGLPGPAAGELWEKSGEGSGNPADPYVPGRVALPTEAGKVVQIAAGAPVLRRCVCLVCVETL